MNERLRRKRRRLLRAKIARALVVVALGAAGYGLFRLASWPGFRLHELAVTGLRDVSRDDVLSRARLDPRANVWLMNVGAVDRRIEALPRVLVARVHRAFPGRVTIAVVERTPAGCAVGTNGRRVEIDETRRILANDCAPDVAPEYVLGAPIAQGPGQILNDGTLERLQNDRRTLAEGGGAFAHLAFDGYGDLDARLKSGVIVRFGDDGDLARKDRLVAPILAAVGARLGKVRAIDLRSIASPVVEYDDAPRAKRDS